MMEVTTQDREVLVRLRHDVWALQEPGTLCLTRDQAWLLRAHLNELNQAWENEEDPEDG